MLPAQVIPRAYKLQRRRGHVTAIVLCVPSKIQWFVTNYSNSSSLDCTMHIEDFCQVPSYMPSSPLGVYKPLVILHCMHRDCSLVLHR